MFKLVSRAHDFIWIKYIQWLTRDRKTNHTPLSDFDHMRYELRPGDVLLIEGQSNEDQIIIESLPDRGTIANTLEKYRNERVQIYWPRPLTRSDSPEVIHDELALYKKLSLVL